MNNSNPDDNRNCRHILVVDDDNGLRQLITRSLSKLGFTASGVAEGRHAVDFINSDNSVLLLLDQKLPDMTGRDIVKELAERNIKVPFIVMTGQGDERLAVEMMRLGASDYLVKDAEFLDRLPGVLERVFRSLETERKLAEAEAEKKNLQTQLIQAQKMESVGRLAGGVAHDFNNMLGAILGFAELSLQQLEPASPLFNNLEQIKKAAMRSADLTRQLLAFARKQTVMPEVVDLNSTITEMLKMLKRLLGENIKLDLITHARTVPVKIDPSQIDQILTNLCVNASDAVGSDGKIIIETDLVSVNNMFCPINKIAIANGQYALLKVTDNGCGIGKENLAHLFEPFFTTKEIGKGTGLGLATVYGIVQQNNGFIDVNSELNVGTTFNIYLPKHIISSEATAEAKESPTTERGCETILLVEDEPSVLNMSEMMLKHLGYKVFAADKAETAIAIARENASKIDMLITDVVMPDMNGRELATQIADICHDIKVLFVSGYTAEIIARHGIIEEGINFIQKPFKAAALSQKIREIFNR